MKNKRFTWPVVIGISIALSTTPQALAKQACQAIGCLDTARQVPSGTVLLPRLSTTDENYETAPDALYRLRQGDVIELNFPFVPTFNHTITIQPDGYVTLHALGAHRVDGLTVPELTERLRAEYASILRDPVITVTLKEFEKPYFIVAGAVERPGKYDLRGETTVTQAVAIAGGLKDRAKHSQAALFRRLPRGGFEAERLDLKKMLNQAELSADLRLASGDMLFIPRGRRVEIRDVMSSLWMVRWLY
jgi:protein involved in polysaccharide export with SLBB domain